MGHLPLSRREVLVSFCAGAALAGQGPWVVAHRGGMAHRPQNTLPAFRHAAELGVAMLEFDMNVTADDRIVLHHDTSVNPKVCTPPADGPSPGPIRSLKLAELRRFDCGAPASPGTPMPILEELLAAFPHGPVQFFGETKMDADASPWFVPPARFVALIDAVIRRYGATGRFILQSGDYRTIDEMRRRNPGVRTCLLNARRFKPDYVNVGRRHAANYLMLNSADVDAAGVRKLHEAGFQVISSTANEPSAWRIYIELGMDGILTDNPEGLVAFLKGR